MHSEEIFIKLTKDHMRRCYRAIILTDKMLELYEKRMRDTLLPEELEQEFCDTIEKYLTESITEEE